MESQFKAHSRLKRALLIDDDAIAQLINRMIIQQNGGVDVCISHYNGATALQLLIQEHTLEVSLPDVIFLDLNMPVMDGFEFLQQLNDRVELSFLLKRTIVLSSSTCASDMAKVKALGAIGYLAKPLTFQKLSPLLTPLLQEPSKPVGKEAIRLATPFIIDNTRKHSRI